MRPVWADYNPMITLLVDNANRVANIHVMEHKWTTGTQNQRRIHTIEVGACKLVLENVNETWYKTPSAPRTFYTGISVHMFLNHLDLDGTGLDRPAGVEIILGLHQLWDTDPCVSQFILAMEETQKKST